MRRLILMLLASLMAVFCVLAYRFTQPRWYHAQVTIENTEGWGTPRDVSPAFYGGGPFAVLESLRKSDILYPVIDQLNLTHDYPLSGVNGTKREAFEELVLSLRIEVLAREPRLAFIGVYDRDPLRTANIANTMAVLLRQSCLEDEQSRLERSLSQYVDEVQHQRKAVAASAGELANLRARDLVSDADQDRPDSAVTGQDAAAYREAKARYLQSKRILELAEIALSKARMEKNFADPIRIREKAVPPMAPLPWWRGDPRTSAGVQEI